MKPIMIVYLENGELTVHMPANASIEQLEVLAGAVLGYFISNGVNLERVVAVSKDTVVQDLGTRPPPFVVNEGQG